MSFLRFLILAIVIALGTVLVNWWVVPVLGLVYGLVSRSTRRPGMLAALAAAVAWAGYLMIVAFGGGEVGAFGGALGRSMGLPSWGPYLATMTFPALLAGPASYIGARLGAGQGRGSATKRR